VPAGCALSTFLCDGVLDFIDQAIVSKFGDDLLFWFRFLDDTFAILADKHKLNTVQDFLNEFHESLNFTVEVEQKATSNVYAPLNTLPFLDLLLINNPAGILCDHFIKPSQTTRTINFSSAHAPNVHRAILMGEIKRSFAHCSTTTMKKRQAVRIKYKYLQNGYPESLIDTSIMKMSNLDSVTKRDQKTTQDRWIKVPYVKGITEVFSKALKGSGIKLACSNPVTIRTLSNKSRSSQHSPSQSTEGGGEQSGNAAVVYAIPCTNCPMVYIGQTGRNLNTRINEHNRCIKKADKSNALARHINDTGHEINLKGTKAVYVERNASIRLNLEAYTIAVNATRTLNISPPNSNMIAWNKLIRAYDVT